MKKIIRYFAKISGVEKDIRFEERHYRAIQILDTAYWFTNHSKYGVMYPLLCYLSGRLSSNHGISGDSSRETYDMLMKSKLIDAKGQWKDIEYLNNAGILHIKQ